MADPAFESVGILGTGTIGASWAAFYALRGLDVRMYDEFPEALERGRTQAESCLRRLVELRLATTAEATGAVSRLRSVHSLDDLARDVPFIHESIRETYEAKKEAFAALDAIALPDAIFASSSSGLLISTIQDVMTHPERALIAHPFNPPHLIPLVELVAGRQTSEDVLQAANAFFCRLGKVPVILRKEVPGHIANRLAAALWREAIDLVANGVATVEDVDKALRAGPGLRWAIMGQHMIYHLGGGEGGYRTFIDHIGKAFEEYWRTMPTWTEIPDAAKEAVIAGVEAAAQGRGMAEIASERDTKLACILRALAAEEAG